MKRQFSFELTLGSAVPLWLDPCSSCVMRRVALSVPGYVEPMLLTLVETPPEGEDWVHEIKYDGYRTILAIDGADTRAFTRNGHDWSGKYAEIVHEAAVMRCDTAVIDGEMIVQNHEGVSDFRALRSAITMAPERLVLYAFDLLMLNGRDLRGAPHRSAPAPGGPHRPRSDKPHPLLAGPRRQRLGGLPSGRAHGSGGHRFEAPREPLHVG